MKKIIIIGGIFSALITLGFSGFFYKVLGISLPLWFEAGAEEAIKYSIFGIISIIICKDYKNLARKGALFGFIFGISELAIKLFYFRENQWGLAFGSFLLPIPMLTFLGFLMGYFFSKRHIWLIFAGLMACSMIHWQYNELILHIAKILMN